MLNLFQSARAWLASVDPAAPAAALILTVFFAIYALRRWFPRAWLWLERALPFVDSLDYRPVATIVSKFMQALPGALLGAAVASLSSGASLKNALLGVLAGFGASLVHEIMANYKGQVSAPKPRDPSGPAIGGVMALCLVLSMAGCGLFGRGMLPALENCAPTKAEIIQQVISILMSGGDYVGALEHAGIDDGKGALTCAVQAALNRLNAPTAKHTDETEAAVVRGRAFLARTAK